MGKNIYMLFGGLREEIRMITYLHGPIDLREND